MKLNIPYNNHNYRRFHSVVLIVFLRFRTLKKNNLQREKHFNIVFLAIEACVLILEKVYKLDSYSYTNDCRLSQSVWTWIHYCSCHLFDAVGC